MTDYTIHTDGGARGNPGPAATGIIIRQGETEVYAGGSFLGIATNNVAEYSAIFEALTILTTELKAFACSVTCYLDSLLVVKQLQGEYKVKSPAMGQYKQSILKLIKEQQLTATFQHIPRAQNSQADALVNQTLDSHLA